MRIEQLENKTIMEIRQLIKNIHNAINLILNHDGNSINNWNDNDLQYITDLAIWSNKNITDTGIKHMTNLTSLFCGDNITDDGIKHMTNLTSLNLQNNKTITDAGIKHLTNLTSLHLHSNQTITDVGIKHLTNRTSLHLNKLQLTIQRYLLNCKINRWTYIKMIY